MDIGFFTTSSCLNDCMLCGVSGRVRPGFYHIGRTHEEKKALDVMLDAFDGQGHFLGLSGGDPLLNTEVLRRVSEDYKGLKGILFNPLTFMVEQLGKRAGKISLEEAESLAALPEVVLTEKNRLISGYLSRFSSLSVSAGSLQSPYPALMEYAYEFYCSNIIPRIMKENPGMEIDVRGVDGGFEGDVLVPSGGSPRCIGRLRDACEDGTVGIEGLASAAHMHAKNFSCGSEDLANIYFRRSDAGVNLMMGVCCAIGMTPYTAYETGLTVDRIAVMTPSQFISEFHRECESMREATFYNLLSGVEMICSQSLQDIFNGEIPPSAERFDMYIGSAGRMLGGDIDLLSRTYALGEGCAWPCEVCYTIGHYLHQAGITPEEWHRYLDNSSVRK